MKQTIFYNTEDPERTLSVFWNTKEEITIQISSDELSNISLTIEDVNELITELSKLLGEHLETTENE
jgi:hypothetical protein